MSDDINSARRAELNNQLRDLEPKIRGLDDLAKVSISPDLQAKVVEQSNMSLAGHLIGQLAASPDDHSLLSARS
jgi:hypothetical protein